MRKAEYRDQACLGMVEASIWYLSEAKVHIIAKNEAALKELK